MANPEDTIDPNDLDSIDALLDEAEWNADGDLDDVAPSEPEATPEVETPESAPDEFDLDPIDAEIDNLREEVTQAPAEEAPAAAEIDEVAEPDLPEDPLPEIAEVAPIPDAAPSTPKAANIVEEKPQPAAQTNKEDDEALEKRLAERQKAGSKNKTNELTVEEMDALKKLIIIFGSVSIVLLLTAIGIATWGALASSSAGISEENQTLIESIKVSSDLNAEAAKASTEAADSMEKKIDAINFQIEQLAADIADMSKNPPAATTNHATAHDVIDPLGLNTHAAKPDTSHAAAPVQAPVAAAPAQVDVKINSEISEKVNSVNYKLIKAQKTMNELATRLKALQSQQQQMLQSVKSVEKEMLAAKAEKFKKQQEVAEKAKQQNNAYQYGPNNDVFYDQGKVDSYP